MAADQALCGREQPFRDRTLSRALRMHDRRSLEKNVAS